MNALKSIGFILIILTAFGCEPIEGEDGIEYLLSSQHNELRAVRGQSQQSHSRRGEDGDTSHESEFAPGDLCPNQTTSAKVCIGAARCTCNKNQFGTFTYLDPAGQCDHPDATCEAEPIVTLEEACSAAAEQAPEPAECNSGDVYPPMCTDAGVTGPNQTIDGLCCTASKERGCETASKDKTPVLH